MTDWLSPGRLDYLPLNERLAVVRLSAQLTGDTWPRYPGLVVGAPHASLRTLALGSVSHLVPRRRAADELLWRVTFAVPLGLVQCPQALFGLVAAGYHPIRLPDPWLATLAALSEPWPTGDRYTSFISAALTRRAAALGTAIAVAGSGFASPVAALAAGPPRAHSARAVVLAPRQLPVQAQTQAPPTANPAGATAPGAKVSPVVSPTPVASPPAAPGAGLSDPAASGRHSQRASTGRIHAGHHASRPSVRPAPPARQDHAGPGTGGAPKAVGSGGDVLSHPQRTSPRPDAPASSSPASGRHRADGSPRSHRPLQTAQGAPGSGLSSLSPTPPAGLTGAEGIYHRDRSRPSDLGRNSHHRHQAAGGRRPHPRHSGGSGLPAPPPPTTRPAPAPPEEPETPTASVPSSSTSGPWPAWTGANSAEAALLRHLSGLFTTVYRPPRFLIPIYKKAAAKYHIPWQILAAINSIETDYGRDLNVSPAGAVGWMQFMPATWSEYGVAVGHSGPPNPYNPADAIFSAARYLAANGGSKHLRRAIFAYNHAAWYVDEVVWRAAVINALNHGRPAPGFANPFPGGWIPNRLDMGYDGTFGHVLAAPFSGTITYAARSFSNWGGYLELRADHRINGLPTRTLYFAEGLSPLFPAGTHVSAGTPIAKPAPSPYGDAYNTTGAGRGQIEWGVAQSGPVGVPTNPLAESGVTDPARVVKAFAIWLVQHLGVAPPASTNHAGYA